MGLFDKTSRLPTHINFSSRAEAFTYMLNYLLNEKKMEPMQAAEQANQFAEIFAVNMGIPLKVEPQPKGVDKYISMAEKIGGYIEAHPKVVEYGIPAITFIAGLFTGKKVEQIEDNHPYQSIRDMYKQGPQEGAQPCASNEQRPNNSSEQEPIDFDKID